ncbi:hypothetical protein FI667_g15720, partial [Globisporangium splendens]
MDTLSSMWNYEKADLSCSNPECSQVVQSSVQHLFWECPKAKLVWNYFYALWAKIGITPGHDPAIWIFSLDLPDTPRHAWTTIKRHIIGHKFSNEHLQDHLYSVAHMLWRYMSASLIHAIWCAHLRRMDPDPIKSTAEMAIMMTRLEAGMRNLTLLAEAQAGDSDGHTVAAVLKAYVDCFLSQTDAIPLTPSDTRGVYLLFFDGGSRGNPGPGGTGSIIVRVHKDSHTASLIWAASMAYSRKDTTNNFAEYWGLIHGLREAQRSHFEPFRRLADCIDIRGWYHHYRAFNKMADSAANLAMDTRTSTQVHFPTQRAAFNNLTQDLDNDVMHWLMRKLLEMCATPQMPYIVGHSRLGTSTYRATRRKKASGEAKRSISILFVGTDPFANNASHTRRRRSTDGVSDDVPLRRILSHQRDHLPRGIKKLGRASRELEGSTYVLCGKCEREAQLALEAGRLPPRMHALVQRSPPSGRSRSLTG